MYSNKARAKASRTAALRTPPTNTVLSAGVACPPSPCPVWSVSSGCRDSSPEEGEADDEADDEAEDTEGTEDIEGTEGTESAEAEGKALFFK